MKPELKLNVGRGNSQDVIHACADLVPVFERIVAEMEKLHPYHQSGEGSTQLMPGGGVEAIIHRATTIGGETRAANSYAKRMNDARRGASRVMNVNTADVLLLAMDTSADYEDIPVLAGNVRGAREMIEAQSDGPFDDLEVQRLAKSLVNFSHGYVNFDAEIVPVKKAEEEAAA